MINTINPFFKHCCVVYLIVVVAVVFSSPSNAQKQGNMYTIFLNDTAFVYQSYPSGSIHPVSNGHIRPSSFIYVNFTNLYELAPNGSKYDSYYLPNLKWTSYLEDVTTEHGAKAQQLTWTVSMPNGANCTLLFIGFKTTTYVTYGHLNTSMSPGTYKLSLLAYDWPFRSTQNHVVMEAIMGMNDAISFSLPTQTPGYRSVTIYDSVMSVTSRVADFAILDGVEKSVPFNPQIGGPTLGFTFTLAYFKKLYYDPDFSVLVLAKPSCAGVASCSGKGTCIDTNLCYCDDGWGGADCATKGGQNNVTPEQAAAIQGKDDKNTQLVVIVAPVVGGAVILAAAAFGCYYQIRRNRLRKKSERSLGTSL